MSMTQKLFELNNAVLAKKFAFRLEELVEELTDDTALFNTELRNKNASKYTIDDWNSFPTLDRSVNFKVLCELRLCIDRLRHRPGISPKYFLNVPKNLKISESFLDQIEEVFETSLSLMPDPLYQPDEGVLLKKSIEIGSSMKKYKFWKKHPNQLCVKSNSITA